MAGSPDGLIPLVVTDHPDLEDKVRIEVTPDEMEKIGKMAIAAVGLETEPTDEEEKPARFVLPLGKFAKLCDRCTDGRSPGERRAGRASQTPEAFERRTTSLPPVMGIITNIGNG